MTYLEQNQLIQDQEFVARIRQAMVFVAYQVSTDEASGKDTLDDRRMYYARQVLQDAQLHASKMAYGVVQYPGINADSTDADIKAAVQFVWNAYAGVNPNFVDKEAPLSAPASMRVELPDEGEPLPWYKRIFRG